MLLLALIQLLCDLFRDSLFPPFFSAIFWTSTTQYVVHDPAALAGTHQELVGNVNLWIPLTY